MWAGFCNWYRIPFCLCRLVSASFPKCFFLSGAVWVRFHEKNIRNKWISLRFLDVIFLPNQKIRSKKKVRTNRSYFPDNIFEIPWSTFHWETNANRDLDVIISIALPMECWSWYFQNVVREVPSVSSNVFLRSNFLIR